MEGVNITVMLVLLAGLVVTILVAPKLKLNIGICILTVVYFTGILGMGKSVRDMHAYFPGNQFILMIMIMFFFGISTENGGVIHLVKKLMSKATIPGWLYPILIYWIGFIVSGIGLGTGGTPVVAWPFMYAIVEAIGWQVDVAIAVVSVAVCAGYLSPLSAGGPTLQSLIAKVGYADAEVMSLYWPTFFKAALLCFIPCLIYMFLRGTFKECKTVKVEDPGDFTPKQKTYLKMIAIYVVVAVFFILMANFVKGGPWNTLAQVFDVNVLALIMSIILVVMKVADTRAVIRNVPYDLVVNVCAIMMLTTMLSEVGFVKVVGQFVTNNVPEALVATFFLIIAALLSAVASGIRVVMPMIFPLIPVITEAFPGISASTLFAAVAIGATITTGSSFSNSGAKFCSLTPNDKGQATAAYNKNMYMPYLILLISAAVTFVFQLLGL